MRQVWRLLIRGDWRMIVALAWDRLFSRSCWAETCCWAMGYEDNHLERESDCPDAAVDSCVGCWCGKFRGTTEGRKALEGLE
jgi:hypothetical protein